MKRSIFYLFCALAVGGTACQKLPEATPSSTPQSEPTPAVSPSPPAVGEKLNPGKMPPGPTQKAPGQPEIPVHPGSGSNPGPSSNQLPPHRKPPVAAKMEV